MNANKSPNSMALNDDILSTIIKPIKANGNDAMEYRCNGFFKTKASMITVHRMDNSKMSVLFAIPPYLYAKNKDVIAPIPHPTRISKSGQS